MKLNYQEGISFTTIREGSLLKCLKHANIIRLNNIIISKRSFWFEFEYMVKNLVEIKVYFFDFFSFKAYRFAQIYEIKKSIFARIEYKSKRKESYHIFEILLNSHYI